MRLEFKKQEEDIEEKKKKTVFYGWAATCMLLGRPDFAYRK